jgi:hypothetical protein
MKKIVRFDFLYQNYQVIKLPAGSEVLDIQPDQSAIGLILWAMVPKNPKDSEIREYEIYANGDEIDCTPGTFRKHIATFQERRRDIHVFELLHKPQPVVHEQEAKA